MATPFRPTGKGTRAPRVLPGSLQIKYGQTTSRSAPNQAEATTTNAPTGSWTGRPTPGQGEGERHQVREHRHEEPRLGVD